MTAELQAGPQNFHFETAHESSTHILWGKENHFPANGNLLYDAGNAQRGSLTISRGGPGS